MLELAVSNCLHGHERESALLERTRAEGVEAETLSGMHNGQLASHGQNSTLAGSVGQLGGGSTHQCDEARRVDHTAGLLLVATHAQHGVLAAEPHTLHVDILGQIPDLLGSVDRVRIIGVHDTGIVEDHIHTTPAILRLDHSLDIGLLGYVAADGLQTAGGGDNFLDLGQGLGQGGFRDISEEDIGTFAGKEDGGFETNATVRSEGLD